MGTRRKPKETASQLIHGTADSSTWERFLNQQLARFPLPGMIQSQVAARMELAFERLAQLPGPLPEPVASELEEALGALDDAVATVDLNGDAAIEVRAALLRILASSILLLAIDTRRRGDVVHDEEDMRIGDDGKVREPR